MTINLTGIAIFAGLSMLVALPARAQPNRPGSTKPDGLARAYARVLLNSAG
jgi:hypothetical protein